MRWALLGLVLLLVVAGLLYRGSVAFVSSLSDAVDGSGTVATRRMETPARPDIGPAGPVAGTTGQLAPTASPATPARPEASPAVLSGPDNSSAATSEERQQRVLQSRRALETLDPREFLRQQASK
jgi:hypothetical protein